MNRCTRTTWHAPAWTILGANRSSPPARRDWHEVAALLTGPVPGGKPILYQKHMTHHLLPDIERAWLAQLTHVFLIRDPREVLASYIKSRPTVTAGDIGLAQQLEIFEYLRTLGDRDPPVIDAGEFLGAPEAQLRALCAWLGIEFTVAHAALAAGPARQRRGVGTVLVRQGPGLERLRAAACASAARACGIPRSHRRGPAGVRDAVRAAPPRLMLSSALVSYPRLSCPRPGVRAATSGTHSAVRRPVARSPDRAGAAR